MPIIFPPIAKLPGDRVFYAPGTKQYRRMVGAKGAVVVKPEPDYKQVLTELRDKYKEG